ncbi:MAG TPA: hypothetical protein VFS49_09880 [Croceibacterium sp.]|nr:hypothetical protein [Croceibacterium sp.]
MTRQITKALIGLASAATIGLVIAARPAVSAEPVAASVPPGLLAAEGTCGGCHALARGEASPNPKAPPFATIVNRPGVTAETLAAWLRDAHNYPEEMEFYLEPREVEELVAYMLTLREPAGTPET